MEYKLYNGLTLAYVGDSYYELMVRKYLLSKGYTKVNDLHKHAIKYTSAVKQAIAIRYLITNSILTEEELVYFKRGRNSHVNLTRKNIPLQDYLDATGLEALVGYLYLSSNEKRIEELMNIILPILE